VVLIILMFTFKSNTNYINNLQMDTLNKNWFLITLVAVVFGLIGFLIGKQSNLNDHRGFFIDSHHYNIKDRMKKRKILMLKDLDGDINWIDEDIENIEIEKEDGENGEKKVKVTVKKKN